MNVAANKSMKFNRQGQSQIKLGFYGQSKESNTNCLCSYYGMS